MDVLKLTDNPFKVKDNLEIMATFDLPSVAGQTTITYAVNKKGDLMVNTQLIGISEDQPILPRFGNNLIIDNAYDNVSWYGRGPFENYQDRKTASLIGSYDAKVADLYFEYIRPQANGNRSDVRTLPFTNGSGKGIEITAPEAFGFSAHHQYNSDFDEGMEKHQRHTYDVPKRDLISINVDHSQMGVGGDNIWGYLPHEQYQIKPGDMSFSYMIKPIN